MAAAAKSYTVNDLLRDLHKLANKYDYTKLLEFLQILLKYMPNRFREVILIEEVCCDTFPWLCDAGCQRILDEPQDLRS